MALRRGLIASLVLHGAVLIIAAGSFFSDSAPPPSKPVAVSIATPSELSQLKSGSKSAKEEESVTGSATKSNREEKSDAETPPPVKDEPLPQEKEQSAPAKQAALPPPSAAAPKQETLPPSQDDAEPSAKAVPVPVRAERPAPRREEQKKDPPPRVAQERPDQIADLIQQPPRQPQRREKSEKFDPDRISALLDRDPNARPEPRESEEGAASAPWRKPRSLEEQAVGAPPEGAAEPRLAYGAPEGRDSRMSANEIDAFRAQISRCWTPPVGGLGSDRIVVKLRIGLREDGSLAHPPAVANHAASPFFRPAAESAMRAVMQCQPYTMPAEKYDQWRDMLLTFDPRQMYGG
jgi:hypothetical protein